MAAFQSGASHELSTDNMADCDLWMEQIHMASQKLTLDSLSLDTTNSFEQQEAAETEAVFISTDISLVFVRFSGHHYRRSVDFS